MNDPVLPSKPARTAPPPCDMEVVVIQEGRARLPGFLTTPPGPKGLVLFAHGPDGSRFDRINSRMAETLHRAGLGTLLLNLLTQEESENPRKKGDLELLADRMSGAGSWLAARFQKLHMPIGFFGARYGAAVAVKASSHGGCETGALVCLDGALKPVASDVEGLRPPSLFIVAETNEMVSSLHESLLDPPSEGKALAWCRRRPGRGLTSDEDRLGGLTANWYAEHMNETRVGH